MFKKKELKISMKTLLNLPEGMQPLKYNFFKQDNDIYFLYNLDIEWLCSNFLVNYIRPTSTINKDNFEPATHAILTNYKKVDGFINEAKFMQINSILEPLQRKENDEIIIPMEFLVHNKSELYDFLKESFAITEDKSIRHQIRNYILNNNYILQHKDMVPLKVKKNV